MEDIIPMTAAQLAARDRADAELRQKYPDHFVGYVDSWDGDTLTRKVIAAAPDLGGFHDILGKLSDDVYKPLRVTHVQAPDAPLFASRLLFDPSI